MVVAHRHLLDGVLAQVHLAQHVVAQVHAAERAAAQAGLLVEELVVVALVEGPRPQALRTLSPRASLPRGLPAETSLKPAA